MKRLNNGTRVRTTKDAGSKDWKDRADVSWGCWGTIVGHSDSHGLVYRVKHDHWGEAWYEREELETLDDLGHFVPIRVRAIEGRIGYEQRQKLEVDLLDAQIDAKYLLELAKQYDIMLIFRDGEIKALIDKQGCRWKQM